MCLPSLNHDVYGVLGAETNPENVVIEARFNVMHTVFLVLQSYSDSSEVVPSVALLMISQTIFQALFDKYFKENMEVRPYIIFVS